MHDLFYKTRLVNKHYQNKMKGKIKFKNGETLKSF